jgi:DnaD/phage-associated family protein
LELTRQQLDELSEFYWDTDVSTKELKDHFGLSKPVHHYITPLATDERCPNCSAVLVYPSRSARERGEKECRACGHAGRGDGWSYRCTCDYCSVAQAEEERRRSEEALRWALERYEEHRERVSTSEHVRRALSKLTRRQKLFLRAFIQVVEESEQPTWEEICDRAGVVSERSYVTNLTQLGLLLKHPQRGVSANSVLTLDMLGLEEEVRKISNALRFEVFQRDRHTCQYCGRRAPEVELEVDHLIPVARGGTDDFENLITSCRECNSGKSAKLIERFTHGHTKESWREKIREKRVERLKERRSEVEDVIRYWAECRNARTVSAYDAEAIYRFVETYDPVWIKAAIRIATRQQRNNYVKYVAGILKNWAKTGPPDYVANPEKAVEDALEQKKATDKQIAYIAGLLDKLGLTLGESYHKSDYDELTRLDARNLIDALTASLEPLDGSSSD